MFALSIAANRVPKAASLHHLHRKGVIQWQIRLAAVACLIFDVKAQTLIDMPRAWPDRGQSIRVITASLFLGSGRITQFSEDLTMRDTRAISPSANVFVIPDIPHTTYRYELAVPSDPQ